MEKTRSDNLIKNLNSYSLSIQERINAYIKKVEDSSDKFSELLSDEGLWLLNNPFSFIKKEEKEHLIQSAFDILKNDIENIDNTSYSVTNYNYDDMSIDFFDKNTLIFTWYVLDKKINIPVYNLLEQAQTKIDDLTDQINAKKDEIIKTKILLKNPDALIQNGYYIAFLKSVIPLNGFKKDSMLLIENLETELNELITKQKVVSEKFLSLKTNEARDYLLDYLSRNYISFPYQVNFDNYKEHQKEFVTNKKI